METVNHECYVSLEVAKLLKKAGFDWEVNHSYPDCESLDNSCPGYMEDLSFYHNLNDGKYGGISVPTLEVAQKWLREVKYFIVESTFCWSIDRKYRYKVDCLNENFPYKYGLSLQGTFENYEEALEAGIKKALEIILEKGE